MDKKAFAGCCEGFFYVYVRGFYKEEINDLD